MPNGACPIHGLRGSHPTCIRFVAPGVDWERIKLEDAEFGRVWASFQAGLTERERLNLRMEDQEADDQEEL